MATDKQVSALSAQLDKVLSKPVSELVQNQAAWGAINFEQARVPLETVVGLANHLKVLPVEILPGATIESFRSEEHTSNSSHVVTSRMPSSA